MTGIKRRKTRVTFDRGNKSVKKEKSQINRSDKVRKKEQ